MPVSLDKKTASVKYVYCIDRNDAIISVSENWGAFAASNNGTAATGAAGVIGHSLWDYIADLETRTIYKYILTQVRAGKRVRSIPFRCDSPQERRFLTLSISRLSDNLIETVSTIVRTEPRDRVRLLDLDEPRSDTFVTICSMCKRIAVAPDEWLEIEDGLTTLGIFVADRMPRLTHGLCPACFEATMAALDAEDEDRP